MSAATLSRSSSTPTGFDRVALWVGLHLVAWSRRRTARRLRIAVAPVSGAPLSYSERTSRMHDAYSSDATHGYEAPASRLR